MSSAGIVLDKRFRYDHKQSRWNAFARNVGDHNGQFVFIDQKKVIKIAAYFFCRKHGSVDVKFLSVWERGEDAREHASLYGCGYVQFCGDPLTIHSDGGQILHIEPYVTYHAVKTLRHAQELIASVRHGKLMELAFLRCEILHMVRQPHNGRQDLPLDNDQQNNQAYSHST